MANGKANVDVKIGSIVEGSHYEIIIGGKPHVYDWGEGPMFEDGVDVRPDIGEHAMLGQSASSDKGTWEKLLTLMTRTKSLAGPLVAPLLRQFKNMDMNDASEWLGPLVGPEQSSAPSQAGETMWRSLVENNKRGVRGLNSSDIEIIMEELQNQGLSEKQIDSIIDGLVNSQVKPK